MHKQQDWVETPLNPVRCVCVCSYGCVVCVEFNFDVFVLITVNIQYSTYHTVLVAAKSVQIVCSYQ